jgi:hypothetical protein
LISFIDDKYTANANVAAGQTGLVWAQQNTQSYYSVEKRTTIKNGEYLEKKVQVDANTYANVSVTSSNVTLNDGNQITISTTKESKTYYDYELEENENKRQIKILRPEFVFGLEQELKNVFNI